MAEPEELDEDLFADLYEGDDAPAAKPAQPAAEQVPAQPEPMKTEDTTVHTEPEAHLVSNGADASALHAGADDMAMDASGWGGGGNHYDVTGGDLDDNYGPINVKEDG